jgi:5-methylcytosine-specific restriction endonuclease McrA
MQRKPNTDSLGSPFPPDVVTAVWQKANTVGTSDAIRTDAWGWTIVQQDFGKTGSRYGWEIDHILPVENGGGDDIDNLQPLHWENNRRKDTFRPWGRHGTKSPELSHKE